MVLRHPGHYQDHRGAGQRRLAVLDFTCPAHFSPPPHIHRDEDELFYLLEGRLEGHCDGTPFAADAGSVVFLPRGLPHGYTVVGDGSARVLVVVTAQVRFDRLVARLGVEATGPGLPAETILPETQELLAIHAELGYELRGPPPGVAAPPPPDRCGAVPRSRG